MEVKFKTLKIMNTYAKPMTMTAQAPIAITERDKKNLERMILKIKLSGRKEESLEALSAELNRAKILSSGAVPPKLVTMGSVVSIVDLDTSERLQYRLIYPDQSQGQDNEISVLSPIGTGILGYKAGDEVEWEVPAGTRRFRIAKIDYQPNAARRTARR